MPIKLEIVAETPQEFAQQLLGALAVMSGPKMPKTVPGPAPEAPASIKPIEVGPSAPEVPAPAKKRGKAPPAKTGGGMPDEKPEEIAQLETATQADVKTALIALLEAKGDDAPPALLKEFGAAKISELKPAVYAKVIARAEAMKAEEAK